MAGIAILKHTYNLSDEAVCERWRGDPAHVCAYQVNMVQGPRATVIPCALIFPPPT